MMNIRVISAGAGSGKTYRLTQEMIALLKDGVRPEGIIATTFTNKAAAELKERVRLKLLESHMFTQAEQISLALIGTVHGLGVKLLQRFAYQAGISPTATIMAEQDQQLMFNQSLSVVLREEKVQQIEALCDKFGLHGRMQYDWRKVIKQIVDIARTNNFSKAQLIQSKEQSIASFFEVLDAEENPEPVSQKILQEEIIKTVEALTENADETKKTQGVIEDLKSILQEISLTGVLPWHKWAKITKLVPGKKSLDDIEPLKNIAERHLGNPDFRADIAQFISALFDIAIAAIEEFTSYKKRRGIIDYTDMEVLVNELLDQPDVQQILSAELDLLMVDEFQDTSPIQLEIFLKLSKLAKYSVWVGDPKQSIYGFRGAEPALMSAVIEAIGGVKAADIQRYSWRSREDIVFATNALFTKAFKHIPEEQVALIPKRTKIATEESLNKEDEPLELPEALFHWHFQYTGPAKKSPKNGWLEPAIAQAIIEMLNHPPQILPKGGETYRASGPGDIAVLCRSNRACQTMANALSQAGFKVAIARNGLMQTAEAKFITAALKYVLNPNDLLAYAAVVILSKAKDIDTLIAERLDFLGEAESEWTLFRAEHRPRIIKQLDELHQANEDLSCTELLKLLQAQIDLPGIISSWKNPVQRLENLAVINKFAKDYEANCTRLHQSSSLGGFLIWLEQLEQNDEDKQGANLDPDAIQVMTYHRSKGLEWPIVICHSLEDQMKVRVWGLHLIQPSTGFDLNHILAGRYVQFWVNPYGDQLRKTTLEKRIHASTFYRELSQRQLEEDARLLYVGMTRARDYLVFPTRDVPTRWLNRIWEAGEEDIPTLSSESLESPWDWEGHQLSKETKVLALGQDFEQNSVPDTAITNWEKPAGQKPHPNEIIDPFVDHPRFEVDFQAFGPRSYFTPQNLPLGVTPRQLSKAIAKYLVIDDTTGETLTRKQQVREIISAYELGTFIQEDQFLAQSSAWHQFLERNFKVKATFPEVLVNHQFQKQFFKANLHQLVECEQETLLIHCHHFTGKPNSLIQKAKAVAAQMAFTKMAFQEQKGYDHIRQFVHFVFHGVLLEVKATLKPRASSRGEAANASSQSLPD